MEEQENNEIVKIDSNRRKIERKKGEKYNNNNRKRKRERERERDR
jgi:hypothetical protein